MNSFATRSFTTIDQENFAELSGDTNPIHINSVAARRSLFGAPVVHGMHLVLWALGEIGSLQSQVGEVRGIQARFIRPVYLEESVELIMASLSRFALVVEDVVTTTLKLEVKPEPYGLPSGCSGTVGFFADLEEFRNAFPEATSVVDVRHLRGLAALSRLVGMECPGLHSIFTSFGVELIEGNDRNIDYHLESFDQRFGLARMSIEGSGLKGRVDAFMRPKPIRQSSSISLSELIPDHPYTGHRVLVIGGSRGLGELTAKLVASGGGSVTITYAIGEQDAASVVDEINETGGIAEKRRYDAGEPVSPQIVGLTDITHLYYFATPHIATSRGTSFDMALLDRYMRIYSKGFHDLVIELSKHCSGCLRAFFPSTMFIDDLPEGFAEYVSAKIAGEMTCDYLNKHISSATILMERLPRMSTDQTVSLIPVQMESAVEVMLPIVKRVQGA